MSLKLIFIATFIMIILSSTAFNYTSGKKQSEFNIVQEKTTKQEDFDGMLLPENSDVPIVTQMTPSNVNIGQRYGVTYIPSLGKKKHKPIKDSYLDHIMSASIVSGGSLISLGVLSMIVMASKAILLAFGAIMLAYLSSGWSNSSHKSESASTIYEVFAKPQVTHGYSYSTEVHHEPYSSSQPSLKDYYGYRRR